MKYSASRPNPKLLAKSYWSCVFVVFDFPLPMNKAALALPLTAAAKRKQHT